MPDLYRLTATEAPKLIAKREISSEGLVESCRAHIRLRASAVQAWAHLNALRPGVPAGNLRA